MTTAPTDTRGAPAKRRFSRAFLDFLHAETSGGIVMLSATALALILANSPAGDAYREFWKTYGGLVVGDWSLKLSLGHWINDGLMAIFFFLVGLEIKRELLFGELASFRRAALPVVAAIGGAVIPAAIFVALNRGGPSRFSRCSEAAHRCGSSPSSRPWRSRTTSWRCS
jgi:NhaA family Na+:H+ antiporter